MSTSIALLDTTQHVKVNSERHYVMLQSLRDTVRLHDIDTDVWVLAMTNRSSLVITEFDTQTIHVYPPEVDLENGWIDHMDKKDNPHG